MFGRKIFRNCLLPVFTIIAILNRYGVSATVITTELKICDNAAETKSPANASGKCKTGGTALGNEEFCINKEKTELYQSLDASGGSCTKQPLTSNEDYYVFNCNTDNGVCNYKNYSAVASLTSGAFVVYKYSEGKFKQIKNNEVVVIGSKLIVCKADDTNDTDDFTHNGKCIFGDNGGVYINPGTSSSITSPLVKVKDANGGAEALTPLAGTFFLDQISQDVATSTRFHKLIKCESGNGGTVVCNSVSGEVDKKFLDESTKDTSNPPKYTKFITCSATDNCVQSGNVASVDVGIYINYGVTNSITDALFKCTSTDCSRINGKNGDYYLNKGSDAATNPIIKCTGTSCTTTNDVKIGMAYLDGGSYDDTNYVNIFKCTSNSECAVPSPELTNDGTAVYTFVNALKTGINDAIITCSKPSSTFYCAKGKGNEGYYLDSFDDNHIIVCTDSDCTSELGSKIPGHAYIAFGDGNQKTIIKYTTKFVYETLSSAKFFIDATNPMKYLESNASGVVQSKTPTYETGEEYFFETDSINNGNTITCKKGGGCISTVALTSCYSVTGEESPFTCKTTSAANLANSKYCIYKNGKIYKGTAAGSGACTDESSTSLITLKNNEGYESNDLSSDAGIIYTCSSNVCTQVIAGYIDETPTMLYSCINGNCKKVGDTVDGELPDDSHFLSGTATVSKTDPIISHTDLVSCPTKTTIAKCVTVSSPVGYYKNYYVTDTKKSLIHCNSSHKCSMEDSEGDATDNGYYLNSGTDKDTKPLIKCTNSACSTATKIDEEKFVLDYSSKIGTTNTFTNLISCSGDTCSNPNVESIPDGYYINAHKSNSLIQCKDGVCSLFTHGGGGSDPKHFYDSINKKVITCTTDCAFEDTSLKGYFLNDGNSEKPVIKCTGATSNTCSEVSAESTCSSVGGIKRDGEGHVFLCVSSTNTDPNHMEIVNDNSRDPATIYRSLQGGSFPGSSVQNFTVRSDKDGKIILMEEDGAGLPACVANSCESGKHCIENNIIKTGNGACTAITGTKDTPAVKYFKKDTTTATPGTHEVYVAYMCYFVGGTSATKCDLIKGYATITGGTSKTVYCRGWNNDPCTTLVTASGLGTDCEKVKLIDNGKVCTVPNGDTLSATKVIFYQSGINEYYGISGNNPGFYVLSLNTDYAIITDENSNKYGYQINPAAFGSNKNALIYCTSVNNISDCQVKDSNVGFYHSGNTSQAKVQDANQLIKCDNEKCTYESGSNGDFYPDAIEKDKIIKCATDSGHVTCSSVAHKGTANAPTYFIENGTSNQLISCTNNGCVYVDISIKGYFLNGAETSGKHLIKCDGSACTEVADTSYASFAGVGSIKVSEGNVYMCIAVGCSGPGVVKIESTSATNSASYIYKTLKISTASKFLDLAANAIKSFKFGNDGSVVLLEELKLHSANEDDTYKLNGTTIKKRVSSADKDLVETESITEPGTKVFFFGSDNKMVNPPTEGSLPFVTAYQCTFIESENRYDAGNYQIVLDKCVQVKGYATTEENKLIHCSGWANEGCSVVSNPKACTNEDEGRLGASKKICLDGESISLPSSSAKIPNYLAFQAQDINPYYGVDAGGMIYLQVTSHSVIAVDPILTENYNLVSGTTEVIVKVGEEYKLYKYNSNTLEAVTNSNGIKSFEMISDYVYVAEAALDNNATVLFYCYDGICQKSNGYIVVGGTAYSNANGSWAEVTGAASASCATAATEVGNIKLASNAFKLCIPSSDTSALADVSSNEYFILEGSIGTNLKMYVAGASNKIIGTPNPEEGYYYIKDNKVTDTAHAEAKLVKCRNKSCTIEATPANGFYYDNRNKKLIKVTAPTAHTFVVATGYYLDSNKDLIECNNTNCSKNDSVGYFVNTGDSGKYIKCTKSGCSDYTVANGECDSDSKIGQLVNDGGDVKLCLKNGKTVAFATASKIVYYHSGSVFRDFVKMKNYFGLLDITTSHMKLDFDNAISDLCIDSDLTATALSGNCAAGSIFNCNEDGVCIDTTADPLEELPASIRNVKEVKEEEEKENTSAADLKIECEVLTGKNCVSKTYYLVDTTSYALAEDIGVLYYCESEGSACSAIRDVGHYVINESLSYACKNQNGEINCEKTEIGATCASAQDIGKVFLNNGKLFLCLNYAGAKDYSVELNATNSGKYVISKGSGDIFGLDTNRYAIITIDDKIITLNTKYENKLKYVYANIKNNYKILEKTDTCPKTTGASPTWDTDNIMEMICTNGICCQSNTAGTSCEA